MLQRIFLSACSARSVFIVSSLALMIIACCSNGFASETDAQHLRARLAHLSPIDLHAGVNELELFGFGKVQDPQQWPLEGTFQRHGEILVLTKDSFGFDIHKIYMVVADGITSKFAIVPIADGQTIGNSVTNSPDIGNMNSIKTVRFVDGELDGAHATLFFVAERLPFDRARDEPTSVRIEIFRLVAGMPADFVDGGEFRTSKKYCNSDMALLQELGVPLPADYQGFREKDGCYNGHIAE